MQTLETRLPSRALIAGCGDVGLRVGHGLKLMSREATAILRDPQKLIAAQGAGLATLLHDLDRPASVGDWPLLFWFAPPPATGATDPRLRHWLAAQAGRIERLVYISTSGVYGDCEGRWVDEEAPLRPKSERAHRRVDAEVALREWGARSGTAIVVLRVPGIYGPGRLPVERLRRGLPVLRPGASPWSNRIHADDLAQAALHAAAHGAPGRAYNIADGNPTTMADYFTRCARLLGLPDPPQVDLDEAQRVFTPAMWSFMEESKRLLTTRMREELRFAPRYPDLERGLPSCL